MQADGEAVTRRIDVVDQLIKIVAAVAKDMEDNRSQARGVRL